MVIRIPTSRPALYWLVCLPSAVAASILVTLDPLVALGLAAALMALVSLAFSGARMLVISVGGVLILQGSQGLSAPKLAYFAYIVVSWVIAILRLTARRHDQAWVAPFRSVFVGSYMLLVLLVVSAPVALGNGVQIVDWARDATPYVLLALLPLIGIDCARDVSYRSILLLFAAVGTVAALGFVIDWLGRRGVSDVGLGKFSLSSFALIAAVFSFAIVHATRGPGRRRWFALAAFTLVAVLVSGARTGVLLLAGFLGMASGPRKLRVPLPWVLGVLATLMLLAFVVTPLIASRVSNDPTFLSQRVEFSRCLTAGRAN